MNLPAWALLVSLTWSIVAPIVEVRAPQGPEGGQAISVERVASEGSLLCGSRAGDSLTQLERVPVDEHTRAVLSTVIGRQVRPQTGHASDSIQLASHPFSRWLCRIRAKSGDLPA